MKIHYIWVEKFKNLINFGLNISSNRKFEYDAINNRLKEIPIDTLPPNFFGEKISDVAGILGENGVGKSNALELVCKVLKRSSNILNTSYIIVMEEGETLFCYYSLSKGTVPTVEFNISLREHTKITNPLKVIFFSNVFDERRSDFGADVSDISINNTFNKSNIFNRRKRDKITSFEKQIRFIKSSAFNLLNIELPSEIQFTSKIWMPGNLMDRDGYGNIYPEMVEFKRKIRSRLKDIKIENKFIYIIKLEYIFYFLNNHKIVESSLAEKILQEIASFESIKTNDLIDNLVKLLMAHIEKMSPSQLKLLSKKDDIGDPDFYFHRISQQLSFLSDFTELPPNLITENSKDGLGIYRHEHFILDYTLDASRNFLNYFIHLFGESGIFVTNWIGISSGHKAYLNLFSSIYHELEFTRQSNLLLCIDEGDLYLHPSWQIEFFNKLIKILPAIFKGDTQILLTSHSPFLLSDLPNQSVTLLKASPEGNVIAKNGVEFKIKTFGGNLYDLYAEPFFLGDKRTSVFAYNKIYNLIKKIETNQLDNSQKDLASSMVNIIGDEVIKYFINKAIRND